jgi:hypothetical protein
VGHGDDRHFFLTTERRDMSNSDDELLQRARRRVKLKTGFYIHLSVYVLVNLGLAHLWPLAGWGLGLAIHGLVTFASLRGEGLQQRMLEQELQRLKRQSGR